MCRMAALSPRSRPCQESACPPLRPLSRLSSSCSSRARPEKSCSSTAASRPAIRRAGASPETSCRSRPSRIPEEYAGQLTSDGLEQNMTIYQSVLVQAARKYQFAGWILQNDPAVTQVMLQINWFDADDNLVLISQSQQLTGTDAAYRELATGELTPPPGAAWARAFVSVAGSGVFSVYVDDLSLSGIDPPVPTDTPVPTQDTPTPNDSVSATPTAGVSPTPTGSPAASPTPTNAVTASPARTPTASPTRTPAPTHARPDAGRTARLPAPDEHRLRGLAR